MPREHVIEASFDEETKLLGADAFELQGTGHKATGISYKPATLEGPCSVQKGVSWTSREALQDRWVSLRPWQKGGLLAVTVLACLAVAAGLSAAAGQSVSLFSASSAAMGSCTTSPELDEGPFYRFEELVRTDLVENEPGVPMDLIITVHDPDCNPLHGVFVDVWSCNTTGIYSGFADGPFGDMKMPPGINGSFNGSGPGEDMPSGDFPGGFPEGGPGGQDGFPGPGREARHTEGHNATDGGISLRGTLPTDRHGMVEFATIVPGWYPGRTEHVHLKIHVPDPDSDGITSGLWGDSHLSHTGQMFFPVSFSDEVAATLPYSTNPVKRTPRAQDMDYKKDPTAVVLITRNGKSLEEGVTAEITVIVDPAARPLDK